MGVTLGTYPSSCRPVEPEILKALLTGPNVTSTCPYPQRPLSILRLITVVVTVATCRRLLTRIPPLTVTELLPSPILGPR